MHFLIFLSMDGNWGGCGIVAVASNDEHNNQPAGYPLVNKRGTEVPGRGVGGVEHFEQERGFSAAWVGMNVG